MNEQINEEVMDEAMNKLLAKWMNEWLQSNLWCLDGQLQGILIFTYLGSVCYLLRYDILARIEVRAQLLVTMPSIKEKWFAGTSRCTEEKKDSEKRWWKIGTEKKILKNR